LPVFGIRVVATNPIVTHFIPVCVSLLMVLLTLEKTIFL